MSKIQAQLTFLLFLFLFSSQSIEAQTERQRTINQFVATKGLEHASIGLCVKDMSGKVIAQHNMNNSYTPASILKIVTTATALEILDANYRYQTVLSKDKNNPNKLLISGQGDPTLGTEHLDNDSKAFISVWADEIAKKFPNNRELEILLIDNYFGYSGVSRKWLHEDIGNYYAAAAYGISVFDNTYRLTFNTEDRKLEPKTIETVPQMNKLRFTNTLSLNTTGKDNGYIIGALRSNERTIIGDIPEGRKRFTIKGDIPDPGIYLGETIANALEQRNIKTKNIANTYNDYISEIYKENKSSYDGSPFHTHHSFPLSEIVREINVKSNNHYAEHLIRTIGRKKNNDIYSLALEEGIEETKDFWTEKGLKTGALFMYDGCGLSPNNAISPELMCDILTYMQTKSLNAKPFLNSFAEAGKEGTVRNFLKGTRLAGKAFVKSGSIAEVQCYAGYYIDGDKKYSFTIMVNKYHAPRIQVVKAIEKLLLNVLN